MGEGAFAVAEKKGIKVIANNRKAFHDYFVEDRYEAGIE
ncbi:MAG: SsrA-binding protein, partial [Oscillospiraceae bacterium]|nr:SsrA-binding protein [Oscillospiraceae bacterium]